MVRGHEDHHHLLVTPARLLHLRASWHSLRPLPGAARRPYGSGRGSTPRIAGGDPQSTLMLSRNSMLLPVFLSLFSTNSIASTGGTPVRARRRMTTFLYSSG